MNPTSPVDADQILPQSPSAVQVPTQTPRFVMIFYLFLFGILAAQISDAHKVHSRFGLAFTGIVQLCCSAVMSFSVLVLLGWNGWGSSRQEPALPTYILPFVIVVVGVENMSTLVRLCISTYLQLTRLPDQSSLLRPFHLLCSRPNRPWSKQSWHDYRPHLTDRPGSTRSRLALHKPAPSSGVLPFRRGSHYHRLVHAAYFLPYCMLSSAKESRLTFERFYLSMLSGWNWPMY